VPPAAEDRNLTHDPPTPTAFRPARPRGVDDSTGLRPPRPPVRRPAGVSSPLSYPSSVPVSPTPGTRRRGPLGTRRHASQTTPDPPHRVGPRPRRAADRSLDASGSGVPGAFSTRGETTPEGLTDAHPGGRLQRQPGRPLGGFIAVRLSSAPNGTNTGVGSHHRRPLEVGAAPSARGRRPGGFVTEPGGLSAEDFPTSQPRHELDVGDRFGPEPDRALTPIGSARQDRLTPD